MTNDGEFCTSGRSFPPIGVYTGAPCGQELIVIAKSAKGQPVTVCPKCDALPMRKR